MSGMLFDVAPEEEPAKRKKRKHAPAKKPEEPSFAAPAPPAYPTEVGYLGKVDGIPCLDASCGCSCHDITDVGMARLAGDRREPAWLVECFDCGTGQWIAPVDGRFDGPAPAEETPAAAIDEFRFDEGPFSGMTPEEVFAQYGRETLVMLANDRRHPAWREPCESHLDRLASAT